MIVVLALILRDLENLIRPKINTGSRAFKQGLDLQRPCLDVV